MHRRAHTPTSHSNKFLHTHLTMRNEQHSHTRTQTNARRERWRMSALSEWVPFLTLLSMRPRVNTADQMAERETKRERERCRRGAESAPLLLLIFTTRTVCLWLCLSICLTLSHTYPRAPSPSLSYAAGKWVSCHGNSWEARDLLSLLRKVGGSRPPDQQHHEGTFRLV